MHFPRRFHRLVASLVAGSSLFLGVSALSANRTELAPLPDQHVANADALDVVVEPVTTMAAPAVAAPAPAAVPFAYPTSPDQWFTPSGDRQGTEGIALFLAGIALKDNVPLYISEQAGRTTGSANSDHYYTRTESWAVDVAVRGIQVPTPQTHLAAKRISTALGVPDWPGGDLTKTINGYRIQVLWLVDGHFNHVHVGVRKVG
ncbi:MAG TPA: hypothetical protein VJ653_09165 [Acidimicrobiales bacterium]|nr:hypothetical protein [Acidimicrobiales bacterium]